MVLKNNMEKTGTESLKDVVIFEKPKYAIRFKKGDKDLMIDELWGVGSNNEQTDLTDTSYNTERLFRFLYLNFGVISPYDYEEFILLNELPSAMTIYQIKDYINKGGHPSFFVTDNHMRIYIDETKK